MAVLCAFAIPWSDVDVPTDEARLLRERIKAGVRFNYNTRALIPEGQPSVMLQDEINQRFNISSDPIAVYTQDAGGGEGRLRRAQIRRTQDEVPAIDQVVSIYTFVPPPETAEANAKILAGVAGGAEGHRRRRRCLRRCRTRRRSS